MQSLNWNHLCGNLWAVTNERDSRLRWEWRCGYCGQIHGLSGNVALECATEWSSRHSKQHVCKTSKRTTQSVRSTMNRVEELRAAMNSCAVELAKLESRPEDDFENGAIITFVKTFGHVNGPEYVYAAIKTRKGWYVTGKDAPYIKSWDSLFDFIEKNEAARPTVHYMSTWKEL